MKYSDFVTTFGADAAKRWTEMMLMKFFQLLEFICDNNVTTTLTFQHPGMTVRSPASTETLHCAHAVFTVGQGEQFAWNSKCSWKAFKRWEAEFKDFEKNIKHTNSLCASANLMGHLYQFLSTICSAPMENGGAAMKL